MRKLFGALLGGLLTIAAFTIPFAAAAQDKKEKRAGKAMESRTFKGADGKEIKYRWLPPAKLEAGAKYPLVLCLHGHGGGTSAPNALGEKSMREKYPCFIMAPESGSIETGWLSTPVIDRTTARAEALPLVVEAVKSLLQKEAIDPARIYVTGQSMGGIGAWGAAARYPDLFAAAVPIAGAWEVKDAPKMVSVPIWAYHGADDPRVPVKFDRELTEALKKAGGTVKYTELAGVGHNSWGPAYADAAMWEWMFKQKKSK